MIELLVTLAVFVLAVAGMSVGVIFGDRRLKGACGGLNNMRKLLGGTPCDACTEPGPDCPLRQQGRRKHT